MKAEAMPRLFLLNFIEYMHLPLYLQQKSDVQSSST